MIAGVNLLPSPNLAERARAAGVHLFLSLTIAGLAALLVFWLWYPYPYREISGGRELFLIVVAVDVVLGPLVTFAIFDRRKSRAHLRADLAVVVLIQLAALAYGLWTVFVARPVHLVFEFDRFRVVHAIDVPAELMDKKPPGLQAMPWTGPTLLSVRPFKNAAEKFDATMAAFAGADLAARPDLWQDYRSAVPDVLQVAKPIQQLKERFPQRVPDIDAVVRSTGADPKTLVYVPMVGRKTFWTVLVRPGSGEVAGFLELDSF